MKHLGKLFGHIGTCSLCGDAGHNGLDLCAPCLDDLPANTHCCSRCALPLPAPQADHRSPRICGRCLKSSPVFDRLIAPFRYEAPCDYLLARLKFAGKLYAGRLIGELLATHLMRTLEGLPDVIVPVPLHPARLRQRGFNQSAQIAYSVAKKLDCRLDDRLLERIRDTMAQMDLPAKQRGKNVRAAFKVCSVIDGLHIALVDDVATTTSTVGEITRLLKKTGAGSVQVWTFARAMTNY